MWECAPADLGSIDVWAVATYTTTSVCIEHCNEICNNLSEKNKYNVSSVSLCVTNGCVETIIYKKQLCMKMKVILACLVRQCSPIVLMSKYRTDQALQISSCEVRLKYSVRFLGLNLHIVSNIHGMLHRHVRV